MAHNLTETDDLASFAAPVTVPDGTDSRNTAAEDVEAIAQVLTDRTFTLLSRAALLAQNNLFTAVNVFEQLVTGQLGFAVTAEAANTPAFDLLTSPDDDPNPGNKWKKIAQALIGGGAMHAMMFSGTPGGEAQLLFTLNAQWDPVAQTWSQQTAAGGVHSFALLISHAGVTTFSRVANGSGAWAAWPVTSTTELRAQTATVTTVNASGSINATLDLNADNDVSALGDLLAGGDVKIDGEYTYNGGVKTGRVLKIRLEDIVQAGGGNAFGTCGIRVVGTNECFLPIRAPIGANLGIASVLLNAAGSGTKTLIAQSRTGSVFTTTTLPTLNTPIDTDTSTASGALRMDVDFGGVTVAVGDQFTLRFVGGDVTDTIYDARIIIEDPGYRGGSS